MLCLGCAGGGDRTCVPMCRREGMGTRVLETQSVLGDRLKQSTACCAGNAHVLH